MKHSFNKVMINNSFSDHQVYKCILTVSHQNSGYKYGNSVIKSGLKVNKNRVTNKPGSNKVIPLCTGKPEK